MNTDEFIDLLIKDEQKEFNENWNDNIDYAIVYEKIKNLENVSAYNMLAYMFRDGKGIRQDYEKAINYFYLCNKNGGQDVATKIGDIAKKYDKIDDFVIGLLSHKEFLKKKKKMLEAENVILKKNLEKKK
jgi:hypothetical protein